MKRLLIFSFILSAVLSMDAQTRIVYGKLTAFNHYPLQNVEVIAKKSKARVTSDVNGEFQIACKEKDIIKIQAKAFKPASKRVGSKTDTLRINLVFVDNEKNREIATGYEYINGDDLAYAISHLQDENNDNCSYSDIFELIEGKVPGVQVRRDGDGGSIIIRGGSSVNLSSEALYVVDEIITDDIQWISPCDVKSIDVIKDGMASYYGSRGANGVVVIKTKRGGDW